MAATTPSPPPSIRTPDTPRFGFADSWEPYSTRKSARISSQRNSSAARTPSPKSSRATDRPRPPQFRITRAVNSTPSSSPKKSATAASMASPAPSPQKKRHSPRLDRMTGALSAEGTSSAAAFLGPPPAEKSKQDRSMNGTTDISSQQGMLPTPSKTPSRKHAQQNEANIAHFRRNLFPEEDAELPDPKQRRPKKYSGNSMDSFTAVDADASFEIFTDPPNRVPQVDDSSDNPFIGDYSRPVPDAGEERRKRTLIHIPGVGNRTVDEASRRTDGLIVTFRGKKLWRFFKDMRQGDDVRRVLFVSRARDNHVDIDEEEAPTDIEDHVQINSDDLDESEMEHDEDEQDAEQPEQKAESAPESALVTPANIKVPATPKAPKYPVSPPTTFRRNTRFSKRMADDSDPSPNPLGHWQSESTGHKRPHVDDLSLDEGPSTKRQRK